MPDDILEPRIVRTPELAPGQWLNTERPFTREQFRGRVVLLDFWDYTCVNCLRTLPYLVAWHRRYADPGLTIIGVHAPEFRFARLQDQVAQAVARFDLPYPVLLDNDYRTWDRFAVKAWPTKILIDPDGYIRLRRQGEGYYAETEAAIQALLHRLDPQVQLPALMPPLRDEDEPGAVCYRPTPEIYAGLQTGGLLAGGLGNPEGYATQGPVFYEFPPVEQWLEGSFYLEGAWRALPESVAYAGRAQGKLALPYSAATVNAVLSPSADPVEVALDLRATPAEPLVEVRQDGRFLPADRAGADVRIETDGRSVVHVARPRMYELVRNPTFEPHELELTFCAGGMALYTLAFTGCVAGPGGRDRLETYAVH